MQSKYILGWRDATGCPNVPAPQPEWRAAYEAGRLDFPETVELFQTLVDCGQAWHLGAHYSHMAAALIQSGHVTRTLH
jgi:hypothetical protein